MINKAILIGNLTRDPEVRATQSGDQVCGLSVATSEKWRDKNTREMKEKTEFHRVTIWNQHLVDFSSKYLRKGAKVFLEGKLETRKWQDQSGNDRYTTEIVMHKFGGELVLLSKPESKDPIPPQTEEAVIRSDDLPW